MRNAARWLRIFSGNRFSPFRSARAVLSQLHRGAVLSRRFAGQLLEDAVELRERLKSHGERDLADPQRTFLKQRRCFFVACSRHVTDEINAGGLPEFLTEIIRARAHGLGDLAKRDFVSAIFVNEMARFLDSDWLHSIDQKF